MKKTLYTILTGLGILAGGVLMAHAAVNCGQVFPTSLNGYTSNCIIPSAWAQALESKIGITGSSATSSLDYQINHIFTSYGSESITSSSLPWINYSTVSLPSSTWLVSSTVFVSTFNGLSGAASFITTSTNSFISIVNTATSSALTFSSSSLNLGTSATHPTTDYLASSTSYSGVINGASSTVAYTIKAGNNITLSTTTTSTVISVNTTAAAAGSPTYVQYNDGGTFSATSTFTFSSSTQTLTLNAVSSTVIIGNKYFIASSTSFSETGASTTFVVPAGVTQITITATGASGQTGTVGAGTSQAGGGGIAQGTFNVTAGSTYYVDVGGDNGYNGGGAAGTGGGNVAGNGGGMTWFGTSGNVVSSTMLIVAPGGGGGGGNTAGTPGVGGSGGGTSGTAGTNASGATNNSTGGGGGTPTTGGAGGAGANSGGTGATGSQLQGAAGGTSSGCTPGAGGGGGWYGGGGSGGANGAPCSSGGGGGGSSFVSSTITLATSSVTGSTTTVPVNGSLIVSYGIPSPIPADGDLDVDGHIITGGGTPLLSSCGTNSSINGASNDTAGIITIGSGLVTSCTLNYNIPYTQLPVPTANLSVTGLPVAITANLTSSVTFSAATTFASDLLYYSIWGK